MFNYKSMKNEDVFNVHLFDLWWTLDNQIPPCLYICNAWLRCSTCGGQPGMRGSMRILVGGTRSISWWSSWWWWWRFKNDWLYEDYDIVKQWYWYWYDIVKQLLWSRHLWRRGDVWKGVHVPDGGVKTCARVVSSKELRLIFFILTGLA